jgi:hypothetical protein
MNRRTAALLDEESVTTILARHFPMAMPAENQRGGRDVVLLELLADGRVAVWEDSLRDRPDPGFLPVFATASCRES